MSRGEIAIRRAGVEDAGVVAEMLYDFGAEFDQPMPAVPRLTERIRELTEQAEITVLLGGDAPDGLAVLRFRPSYYHDALDAHLEDLYVVPERRGHGVGRALLEAAIDSAREAGAAHIDLGTSVDDRAAIGLYESTGFTNREGRPDGPVMLYYERDL